MDVEEYAKTCSMERELDKLVPSIILKNFKKKQGVLDLGVGDGLFSRFLKKNGMKVIAFDKSRLRAKRAKVSKNDCIAVCDAQQNCFKKGSFDGIICIDVIEHVPKPELLVEEAARCLKKNGAMIITTPNYPAKRLYDIVSGAHPLFKDDPTHISKFNYFRLKRTLRKHFREIETIVDFSVFDKRLAKRKSLLKKMQLLFGHKFIAVCRKPKKT